MAIAIKSNKYRNMNYRLIIAIIFACTISAFCAEPIKFEDYKQLSKEERQKAVLEATPELQKQYIRWDQILSMGGQWWDVKQAHALISSKGLGELGGVFTTQVNIWGWYGVQRVDAYKKAGMTEEQAQKAAAPISDTTAIKKEWYKDSWWYLVKLAPTPEALALNKKAAELVGDWYKRFDGKTITTEDLKNVDAAAKEIRDQMRKLPQMTPEQIETALAALPEEPPHR